MFAEGTVSEPDFVPTVITPGTAVAAAPAEPIPSRIEVMLRCGRRIIMDSGIDVDAVLPLAWGLEALP